MGCFKEVKEKLETEIQMLNRISRECTVPSIANELSYKSHGVRYALEVIEQTERKVYESKREAGDTVKDSQGQQGIIADDGC